MKLVLDQVTKYYDKMVLDHLCLKIEEVHSIGIIGQSGCGQSTLLRQLAGMEFPEEGNIFVNDLKLVKTNVKLYQEKIGYVFQKHNLFPHLSLKENLMLILHKIKKVSKVEATDTVNSLFQQLHLTGEADKKPNQVSGGQAQRASIARALCTNPDIVCLDEPTAALDPILTDEVLQAIKELKKLGKDFVFVTHEVFFLREFADYIIFMHHGKIVEHGAVTILEKPQSDLLKRYLKKVMD